MAKAQSALDPPEQESAWRPRCEGPCGRVVPVCGLVQFGRCGHDVCQDCIEGAVEQQIGGCLASPGLLSWKRRRRREAGQKSCPVCEEDLKTAHEVLPADNPDAVLVTMQLVKPGKEGRLDIIEGLSQGKREEGRVQAPRRSLWTTSRASTTASLTTSRWTRLAECPRSSANTRTASTGRYGSSLNKQEGELQLKLEEVMRTHGVGTFASVTGLLELLVEAPPAVVAKTAR